MVHTKTKLQMQLSESEFAFSKRMRNFFTRAEIYTVEQLTEIPLGKLNCFRGFKAKCKQELIAYIEFEQLQDYFMNYLRWRDS